MKPVNCVSLDLGDAADQMVARNLVNMANVEMAYKAVEDSPKLHQLAREAD